ncbi:MAG TPA: amino acid adenylation domain-containing protein [Thermoanaerobaculia bacterium]|nr:amino acid adenylation domain-containing protein [Thermoanaerobaculia bacterium]
MSAPLDDFERLSPAKQKLLLARLEKLRRQQGGGEAREEAIARSPLREHGGPFPLSFAQQRLWFIDRLDPGDTSYNVPDALRLRGRLEVPVLARALSEIVRRHEALRTVFEVAEGRPVQRIVPPAPVEIPLIDLSGLGEEAREAEAQRLAAAEARTPFDVPRGPHLRIRLLRLQAAEHVALFTLHHIVSDGWSMGVLVREVAALYAGSPLPELPVQYPDFADWQRRRLSGDRLEEHLRWWREALAGMPLVLDLPADRPRPAVQSRRGATVRVLLPPDLSASLSIVGRSGGETLFMVLLAAFGVLLARHAGTEDLCAGSVVANRNRLETEGLIGFFVNTLALRIDLRGTVTFRDLLDRVRRMTLGAYAHQDLPFERLVEELQPARDLSRPPLVQVSFVLQNAPAGPLELPGLTLEPLAVPEETSLMDLSVEAMEVPGGIAANWRFSADLFDAATIERMAGRFRVLLEGVAAGPDRALSDLPWMTDAEREQVLRDWSGAAARSPETRRTFPELFAERAARHPETTALVFGTERETYGELNARANRLARHLRRLGVGPEVVVGLWAERSPTLIEGMLAVQKAGGAFLPLDPAIPRERLAFLLEDAAVPVVLGGVEAGPEGTRLVPFDAGGEESGEDLEPQAGPDNAAYVLYTSGSTGLPKGVVIPHAGLSYLIEAQTRLFGAGPGDRVLQLASPGFDASVLEVALALAFGAELHLAPREELLPGPGLARLLTERGITHALLPPPILAPLHPVEPPTLGTLIVGGEACPPDLPRRWGAGRRLFNAYGPTEGTVFCTVAGPEALEGRITIGRPVHDAEVYVLDRELRPAPAGVPGELCLGGAGLARGYLRRPDFTAERFVPHPFAAEPGARLYRTGDLVRWLADGALEFLGRIDRQVKVRGVRVEPGEVEAVLGRHPEVGQATVDLREGPGGTRLVAWVVPRDPADREALAAALRVFLRERLPEALVPAAFVLLDELPLNPSGKVDRAALPDPEAGRREAAAPYVAPRAGLESAVAAVWREVLGVEEVGAGDNFFDLGGHSLLLVELQARLAERLGEEVALLDLFRNPNVASLARFLEQRAAAGVEEPAPVPVPRRRPAPGAGSREVAVIGMACRFPGAASVEGFWHNLREGVESISFFSDEELLAAGTDPALLADPAYVRAAGVVDGVELFDAAFFDVGPREAQLLDPQHRFFLEHAAEALERAGYGAGSPGLAGFRVGVWAGSGMSGYALRNLAGAGVDGFEATLGNDKDFVATRTSYKLDLRGPAMAVQTACSTSLVAVHAACQALLDGECEMALAGGVSLQVPMTSGYLFQEGGIASPDGHNRAFDAAARGTVAGNGVGVVVLKPLAAALADGDPVHAVIRGSALNNDGSGKVGFTAPSEEGQAAVISEALAAAGVEPGTIGCVEAHGSATPLGDPIEVAALTRVFRGTAPPGSRLLGSVKTNIGHTNAAAGVAGLLKAVLAIEHGEVPPSLHFETPNPRIDFAASPFRVAAALEPWPETGSPRRAGVSSFGLGGTNAHVVLEEAPAPAPSGPSRPWKLLSLSARTPTALDAATARLAEHLRAHPEQDLADVAFTLHVGRKGFEHRRTLVARDREDALAALEARDPRRLLESAVDPAATRPVAFLFSGLGEQYPGMARDLHGEEPVFREELDCCAEILAPLVGLDIRDALFAEAGEAPAGGLDLRRLLGRGPERERGLLDRTAVLQPALFAVEYALARLWMDWGVRPQALLGYSLGEYVAAAVAGVLSLEDSLKLVAGRARLLDGLPEGAMLAVPLPAGEVEPLLGAELSLAVINAPRVSVVAGPAGAVADLQERLESAGHACRRLRTEHAFHSEMMRPVAGPLSALAREVTPRAPRIPYLSNVTGTWITPEAATDPEYWARHLLATVRFADGIGDLWREPGRVLLEIGPGASLSSLALQHPAVEGLPDPVALPSLPSAYERTPAGAFLLGTLGKLWLAGVGVDWPRVYARERRRRVVLPTYSFERRRYWIDRRGAPAPQAAAALAGLEGALVLVGTLPEPVREAVTRLAEEAGIPVLQAGLEEALALREQAVGAGGVALHARPSLRNPYIEPSTDLERSVTAMWQTLLGVDRVGIHDSFFELGGDSLLATQVAVRVREGYGVEIALPELFENPTPAGLAALIERGRPAAGGPDEMADLLAQLEALSPEEVERMLAERGE